MLFLGVLEQYFMALMWPFRRRFLRRSSLLGLGMEDFAEASIPRVWEGACLQQMLATVSSKSFQAVSWSFLVSVTLDQSMLWNSELVAPQSAELKLMSYRGHEGVKTGRSGV